MNDEVEELLVAAIDLAAKYKKLTGKPLGITGEVAEFYAAKLLGLKLMEARSAGYDATGSDARKIQIKGRSLANSSNPGQRVGSIRLEHEWDSVILVLMDDVSASKRCGKHTALKSHLHYSHLDLNPVMNEGHYLSVNSSRLVGRFGLLTPKLDVIIPI
ncbi:MULTISPECIES: DUF6998 domain-containing protein [Pectobacterium]|uniref:DUF6998 domain-containing protein n=1 Tax=Pectobacterium carotovorum subsp. carotovorum (strain PC1) TaxID=561230 RepID=C6DEH8_PECCP|nr:hypothetical protein [Pectobacterium carotovorum]ACT12663.1 hypothetical protein PC1_1622 [Pectobacterium carotovorum subsp. carotovorum PC1]